MFNNNAMHKSGTQSHLWGRAGFTLIEILVVLVIIGVLAGIGIPTFYSSQMKSRDTQRKSDLKNIQKTLEVYYNDVGGYPSGDGLIEGCGGGQQGCAWGEIWQDNNNTIYMVQMPEDPRGKDYYYVSSVDTQYRLYALLENLNDPDVVTAGFSGTDCDGEGALCNYGVSSSNITP